MDLKLSDELFSLSAFDPSNLSASSGCILTWRGSRRLFLMDLVRTELSPELWSYWSLSLGRRAPVFQYFDQNREGWVFRGCCITLSCWLSATLKQTRLLWIRLLSSCYCWGFQGQKSKLVFLKINSFYTIPASYEAWDVLCSGSTFLGHFWTSMPYIIKIFSDISFVHLRNIFTQNTAEIISIPKAFQVMAENLWNCQLSIWAERNLENLNW